MTMCQCMCIFFPGIKQVTYRLQNMFIELKYGPSSVYEGGEQGPRSKDWASKSACIADFSDTLSGFADFKNTADHVLTENFGPDS